MYQISKQSFLGGLCSKWNTFSRAAGARRANFKFFLQILKFTPDCYPTMYYTPACGRLSPNGSVSLNLLLYRYIYFRNVYSPCLSGCLGVCLSACGIKHTSRTLPEACDTSLEPSRQNKLIREKKSRFARTARPHGAKTCTAHYISHLKTTV